MDIIERIARVLAGCHYSRNAHGATPPGQSAAELVDASWEEFEGEAVAVLKAMRDPPPALADDPEAERAWERVIASALGVDPSG